MTTSRQAPPNRLERRRLAALILSLAVLLAPVHGASRETTSSERTQPMSLPIVRKTALPPLPDAHGFAGPFAGISEGALIVAGGANFPGKKPWDGGKKVWHDTVFVLADGATSWTMAGRLPRPIAYGVSITLPDGVLCIGGEDAQQTCAEVFLMRRQGAGVVFSDLPALPAPCANACGVLLDGVVYVLGGTSRPGATAAGSNVYALDLGNRQVGWRTLQTWPGRPRMLATAAAVAGGVLLCSGVDLAAGTDGKPVRTYLSDAYRYESHRGWTRIADLPRPAVAAPSPAPVIGSCTLCIIGGDDGKLAGRPPGPDHPGFIRTALWHHTATNTWTEQPYDFPSPVTLPAVPKDNSWILPSGEVRPGIRTPQVTCIQFTKE